MSNIHQLTKEQLQELYKLECNIYKYGVDGGELTSEAIDELHNKEKEFGVFIENAKCPRWKDING